MSKPLKLAGLDANRIEALAETFESKDQDVWTLVAPGPLETAAVLRAALQLVRELKAVLAAREADPDMFGTPGGTSHGELRDILDRAAEPPR